jgi:hypothetical protein
MTLLSADEHQELFTNAWLLESRNAKKDGFVA